MNKPYGSYSPSSAERWIKCPGSVAFTNRLGIKRNTSAVAAKGTLLHKIAYTARQLAPYDREHYYNTLKDIHKGTDMEDSVKYAIEFNNFIACEIRDKLIKNEAVKNLQIFEEKFFNLEVVTDDDRHIDIRCIPDYVIYEGNTLTIYDLKTGHSKVEAKDNAQLFLYALGVIEHLFGKVRETDCNEIKPPLLGLKVQLVIFQPSIYHTSYQDVSLMVLFFFYRAVLCTALSNRKRYSIVAGEKQCRYCPAKHHCPQFVNEFGDIFEHILAKNNKGTTSLNSFSNEAISIIAKNKKTMENYIAAAESVILDRLIQNNPVPGFLLSEGQGNRSFESESKALEVLTPLLNEKDLYASKLKSISQIENMVKKSENEEAVKAAMKGITVRKSLGYRLKLDTKSDKQNLTGDKQNG